MNILNSQRFNPIYFGIPLIIGMVFQLIPHIGWNLEYMPGDLGDTRFNIFVLEHGYQFLSGKVDSFWNAGFMHPEPEVISLSDNLLGTMPLYAIFRLFGADIFTAFQLWLVFLALLNYFASYKLVHYVTNNDAAAGIGAFIFSFSLGLAAQMNHAQMFPRFAIPLMVYFVLRWQKQIRVKDFIFALSFLVYLFYCGIYLGFMGCIPFTTMIIWTLWKNRMELRQALLHRNAIFSYSIGIVLNLFALLFLFIPYLRRAKTSPLHSYSDMLSSIPTPKSYLSAFPGTPIHGFLEKTTATYPAYWDHWIFPGWIALFGLLFLMFAIFNKKLRSRQNWKWFPLGLAALVTFFFFLRMGQYSPYYFLHLLPGFGAMRSMTRIINIELLFMGLGAAYVFIYLLSAVRIRQIALFLPFVALLSIDNYLPSESMLRMPKVEMIKRHETMREKFQGIPSGAIVSYEPETPIISEAHLHLDVMLAAQSLGLKSVNGYSGSAPIDFWKFWMEPNEASRIFYFERFNVEDIGEVIVVK